MHSKTVTKIISLVVFNALTALLIFQINFAGGKSSPTLAQTTSSYSATWTVDQCRFISGNLTDGNTSFNIKLGAASWNVSYSINGVQDAIKEKWVASGWLDNNPDRASVFNLSSITFSSGPCTDGELRKLSTYARALNTGLYGFAGFYETNNSSNEDWDGGGSYPTGWKVCKVNAFTDPCS